MRLKPLGASIYIEVKKRSDLEKILTHYKKANWKRPNNRDTRAMANELFTKNKSIFISAGIPHCENSVVFPCLTPRSITHKNTIITPEEFFHRRRCPEFQNSQRKRPKLLNILSVKNQTPDNASPPKHLTSNQGGPMQLKPMPKNTVIQLDDNDDLRTFLKIIKKTKIIDEDNLFQIQHLGKYIIGKNTPLFISTNFIENNTIFISASTKSAFPAQSKFISLWGDFADFQEITSEELEALSI